MLRPIVCDHLENATPFIRMHIQSTHEIATQPYDTDQIPLKYVTPGFKLFSNSLIPILACYKEG